MRSKQHRQSLSLHAWVAILIIATLAVMSTLGSGALAWVARSDAEAINVAGSVRMATYRLNFQIATDFSDDHPFSPSLHVGQNIVGAQTNAQSAKQDALDFANKTTAEKIDILSRDMENRLEELQVYQLTSANRHVRINEQLKEIKEQW